MAKRRGQETVRDLVLTLVVLLGGVVVFTLLLPRNHRDPVTTVEVAEPLRLFAARAPYDVIAPRSLPGDWRPTSFRTQVGAEDRDPVSELTIGYVIDRKPRSYAVLAESNAAPADFVRRVLGDRAVSGRAQVAAGGAYDVRRDEAGHVALTRTAGGVTVIVSDGGGPGGANRADLERLAASLAPTPRP